MTELKFVGLHAHSLSPGDSIGYPKDHFDYAKSNGMNAMAITDHGQGLAFGYMNDYAKACKAKGDPFKTIYGVEAYIHPSLKEWAKLKALKDDKDEATEAFIENERESKGRHYDPISRRHHLVIVVKNQVGLKNLFNLVSKSYRNGFFRYPRMDFDMLREHKDGLMISSACVHPKTLVTTSLGVMTIEEVSKLLKKHSEIYVLGFNIEQNKLKFEKIKWATKTKKNQKLIMISTKDGKKIKLTKDHKVFTDKGWVQAGDLTKDHKILSL